MSPPPRTDLRREALALGLFLFALLLSRLPFLAPGYGLDGDAWRVALAARTWAEEGRYVVSRLPGYPVQELFFGVLGAPRPWIVNGITLLFGVLCTALVYALARAAEVRNALACAAAFAFVPAVQVNSVNGMDYLPALAFVLGGFLLALRGRSIGSGVLIGIATGIRLTSVLAIVPMLYLLWHRSRKEDPGASVVEALRPPTLCLLAGGVVGVVVRVPVFMVYGTGSFGFYDSGYPALSVVGFRATAGVWGLVGLAAVGVAALLAAYRLRGAGRLSAHEASLAGAAGMAVGLYALLFLWKPYQAEYLLPAVPFFLLLLFPLLRGREAWALAVLLALSGLLGTVTRSGVHLPGPLLLEHSRRVQNERFRAHLPHAFEEHVQPGARLVCGELLPMTRWTLGLGRDLRGPLAYTLDAEELQRIRDAGGTVWFLAEQDRGNRIMAGVDLLEFDARELPVPIPPVGRFD